MIRYSFLILLIQVFACPLLIFASETWSELYYDQLEEANRGVVCIEGSKIGERSYTDAKEFGKAFTGMGTGIIIDPRGYIATNQHVVEGLQKIIVTTYEGERFSATSLDRDHETDIALLKIDTKSPLQPVSVGNSHKLRIGERVSAIGNPFGYNFSLTEGIISRLGCEVPASEKLIYKDMIQTSAQINPGNSGGPLLNNQGEVVAMNVAIHSGAQGIAFAMPIEAVMDISAKLIEKQTDRFCYHGISVEVNDEGDLVVVKVDSGSPADTIGVTPGDIVSKVDDCHISHNIDFQRAFLEKQVNDSVNLQIKRFDENLSISLRLGSPGNKSHIAARPIVQTQSQQNSNLPAPNKGNNQNENISRDSAWEIFGVKVRSVSPATLKNYSPEIFNDYPDGAVQIVSLRRDGILYKSGLKDGDMLTGIVSVSGGKAGQSWTMASEGNLNWIANMWNPQLLETDVAEFHVIRNKVVYYPKISLENSPSLATSKRNRTAGVR